jgi:hypothetical protein
MSLQLSIFSNARSLTPAALEGFTRDEVVNALRRWFELWEGRPHLLDFEVIGDAGSLLGSAGYGRLDDDAMSWSAESPSVLRREIAADFVAGYWRTAPVVSVQAVSAMTVALDTLPMPSSAYASSLLALYRLTAAAEQRIPGERLSELRATLVHCVDLLEATGLHQGVVATLTRLRG